MTWHKRAPVPGRTALITGAASGIGRAVAEQRLREGAHVIAVDRDERGLAPLRGMGAETLVADLADPQARSRVVDAVDILDQLVNAAGYLRMVPLEAVDMASWRHTFALNTEAVFFLCQQLSRRLRPGGAIVNVACTAAKTGSTLEAAAYAASKAALLSIIRTFAHALARRPVRVNAVCPGYPDTHAGPPPRRAVPDPVDPSR